LLVIAGLGTATTLAITSALVRRRRGVRWQRLPGRAGRNRRPTVRDTLLLAIERRANRAVSRWIAGRADHSRHRGAVTPELLLPALWPPVRLLLRESVGVSRTELVLLLRQAKAVLDDAAPAQDRLLTLLHLVHRGFGRAGVRRVLNQARRSPVHQARNVTAGMPAAGTAPVEPEVRIDISDRDPGRDDDFAGQPTAAAMVAATDGARCSGTLP
jgi:hypothetical protein